MFNMPIRGYYLDILDDHKFQDDTPLVEHLSGKNTGFFLVPEDVRTPRLSDPEIRLLIIEHLHARGEGAWLLNNLDSVLTLDIWSKDWAWLSGELVELPQRLDNIWTVKGYYQCSSVPRVAEILIQ